METLGRTNCVFCGNSVDMKDFRTEKHKNEYRRSGTCQKCQDDIAKLPEVD